jgi:formate hydrogenlyase subunit 6/NADH:ubiquinone oxidoreductase subunit I
MAHRTLKTAYSSLADRINRFPQGAPPTAHLFSILRLLFREDEAALVAKLPIRPITASDAAAVWKMPLSEAQVILDDLAGRALLVDYQHRGRTLYVLPPPMAGFFEFSMMRVRDDIDQKALSELFYQYLNVEQDFMRELVGVGETQLGRTFVHEPALSEENALHVLDYERSSEVIETARHIGVGLCYCRHKAEHLGHSCSAPMEICMTFGPTADSLIRHGHARRVDRVEGRDLLQEAWDHKLVQFGENVRNDVAFICNCCGCCCEAMIAARRFAVLNPVHTTNFLPVVDEKECSGCGKCVSACPVAAMSLVSANDPARPKRKQSRLDEEVCLGCGVCVRACTHARISLKERPARVMTPANTMHRVVLMAIERGKLAELIFDNQVLWHHRALAAVVGTILRLPPIHQIMASEQFRSRYLERMMSRR